MAPATLRRRVEGIRRFADLRRRQSDLAGASAAARFPVAARSKPRQHTRTDRRCAANDGFAAPTRVSRQRALTRFGANCLTDSAKAFRAEQRVKFARDAGREPRPFVYKSGIELHSAGAGFDLG